MTGPSSGPGPGYRKLAFTRTTKSHEKKTKPPYTGFARIQKYTNLPLPDGTHRRKLEKIKSTLIHKAKVVKTLRKIKSQSAGELAAGKRRFEELARLAEEEKEAEWGKARRSKSRDAEDEVEEEEEEEWNGIRDDGKDKGTENKTQGSMAEMHPDRITRRKEQDAQEEEQERKERKKLHLKTKKGGAPENRKKRPTRFDKELSVGAQVAAEHEAYKKMVEEREAERRQREQDRERWSKAVKAKTRTGQIKLGKQSGLLFEKIKRQMEYTR